MISKFSPDLRTLLASTFIGGSDYDAGTSIVLDSGGNVYVTGRSNSADYPTTAGAYDKIFNGGIRDIVVSKLTSDLSTLLASTYLGGQAEDTGLFITLDDTDNVYLTGNSSSGDYPVTEGAFDRINDGSRDVIISKLSSDLGTLLASTFVGGASGSDSGNAIAFDSIGNVYMTGDSRHTSAPMITRQQRELMTKPLMLHSQVSMIL